MRGRLPDGSAEEADNSQQVMMWQSCQRDAGLCGKKQITLMTAELSFMEGSSLQRLTDLDDTASYVAQLRQITPYAINHYMIYSQKILHIRLPLVLLRETVSSSPLSPLLRRYGNCKNKKKRSNLRRQTWQKHYACASLAWLDLFSSFFPPPLKLSCNTVISFSWRPHPCPRKVPPKKP